MHKKSMWRIIIPGMIGNILEWYDFALYGYFAVILSPLFFPSHNKTISLLSAFSVFAIGFIMRPIGALLFGYIGDKSGRKHALSLAILLMAIPTTLIGLLPTYQNIGMLAPILLTLLRLLQGLAVGGEFTGAMVYILEHSQQKHMGLYGALAISSGFFGLLLGSIAASIVLSFDIEWLWRIPFLISLFLGFIGLYLRLKMPETPEFIQFEGRAHHVNRPISELFRQYRKHILIGVGIVMLPTAAFYMCFLFMTSYLSHYALTAAHQAQLYNNIGLLFLIIATPICGLLADKYGFYKIQALSLLFFILFMIPLFLMIQNNHAPIQILAQMIMAFMVGMCFAAIPALLYRLFPVSVRYTGLSLPYNLATAIFGGTTPAISTALIHFSNIHLMPSLYIIVLAISSMLFLYQSKDMGQNQCDA